MEVPAPNIEVKRIGQGTYRCNKFIAQLGNKIRPEYMEDEGLIIVFFCFN